MLRFFGVLLLISSCAFLFVPIWGDSEDSEPYSTYEAHSFCGDAFVYLLAEEECEEISDWFVIGMGGVIIGLVLTLIPRKSTTVVNNYVQEQKTTPIEKKRVIENNEDTESKVNYCPQCGTKLQVSGKFCPGCGGDLRI
jgi:hypothetical protein